MKTIKIFMVAVLAVLFLGLNNDAHAANNKVTKDSITTLETSDSTNGDDLFGTRWWWWWS